MALKDQTLLGSAYLGVAAMKHPEAKEKRLT